MQPHKSLSVLLVLAAVLVSGCTLPGAGTTGTGKGVAILEFTSDFSSIQSGEPVQLQVKVQNQGEVKAINTRAELTGIDVSQWGGTFGASFTINEFGDLLPYDKETNTPGSIRTKAWKLMAPDQPKGINQLYTPIVKVSYDYKTSAQKLVTIVDEAELRRILQSGGTLPGKSATFSSGPLSIEITTGNYEKTTAERFGFGNLFPVQIRITNTGGGMVVPPGTGTGLYGGSFASSYFGDVMNYPVGVRVTPPSGTSFASLTGGFGGFDDCSTGTVTKEMWKGQEAVITCELSVNTPPTYREDRPLLVEVFYRYQVEASTPLQVFGQESGLGGYSGIGGYGW